MLSPSFTYGEYADAGSTTSDGTTSVATTRYRRAFVARQRSDVNSSKYEPKRGVLR
jgi:hypothetical protein